MKFSFLVFTIFITSFSYSQDLQLKNGNKSKIINPGTYIQIGMPNSSGETCSECNSDYIKGKLISYSDGKLSIQIIEKSESISKDNEVIGVSRKAYTKMDQTSQLSIPKELVLYVQKYKNEKMREATFGDVLGRVLFGIGIGHLVASPLAYSADRDSGNVLVLAGLGSAVGGIILGISFQRQYLITNTACPQWSEGKKLWEIQ